MTVSGFQLLTMHAASAAGAALHERCRSRSEVSGTNRMVCTTLPMLNVAEIGALELQLFAPHDMRGTSYHIHECAFQCRSKSCGHSTPSCIYLNCSVWKVTCWLNISNVSSSHALLPCLHGKGRSCHALLIVGESIASS